eukprot:159430-Chlamydomonas_euryale.AAC.2
MDGRLADWLLAGWMDAWMDGWMGVPERVQHSVGGVHTVQGDGQARDRLAQTSLLHSTPFYLRTHRAPSFP